MEASEITFPNLIHENVYSPHPQALSLVGLLKKMPLF